VAFHLILKQIRKELGHKSGRSFFNYLSSQTTLDFNYSYYARIESGKVLPSPKIVSTIAQLLHENFSDQLVMSYCQEQFPKKGHLFDLGKYRPQKAKPIGDLADKTSESLFDQQTLSLSQIQMLGKDQAHYFLFLLTTLARRGLLKSELEIIFKEHKLDRLIQDLLDHRLLRIENTLIFSMASEMKFPPAQNTEIKKIYQTLDLWDGELPHFFGFNSFVHKFLFRRISPRFFSMIVSQCELVIKSIQASEETQINLNNEVVVCSLRLSKGHIPG
jgi:hypothetical protein